MIAVGTKRTLGSYTILLLHRLAKVEFESRSTSKINYAVIVAGRFFFNIFRFLSACDTPDCAKRNTYRASFCTVAVFE